MKRKLDSFDLVSLGVIGCTSALTGALYTHLPARVPVHFNAHGAPNGWMDRPFGAWLMPAVALGTWALLRYAKSVVPSAWAERTAASPTSALAFLFATFLSALHVITLYAATHPGTLAGQPLVLAISTMWLALGQVLPRVRRNPIIGIRTAWTLTSDENWLRTHRVAGYTFSIAGLVALLAELAAGNAATPFAVAAFLMSAAVPAVYSYFLAHRVG
jgi:uncharacterized membrane protein